MIILWSVHIYDISARYDIQVESPGPVAAWQSDSHAAVHFKVICKALDSNIHILLGA